MVIERIQSLMFMNLVNQSPVLSGNMKMNIQCGIVTPKECEIKIDAPFYDMDKWKKEGTIIHTGENINGRTDYAYVVNEMGAFGSHNKSEHWVNRCMYEVALEIAKELGAEVINRLPL